MAEASLGSNVVGGITLLLHEGCKLHRSGAAGRLLVDGSVSVHLIPDERCICLL